MINRAFFFEQCQQTLYTAYAEGGYYPGCWLDPKLNEAEFSVFDLNPCRTIEP